MDVIHLMGIRVTAVSHLHVGVFIFPPQEVAGETVALPSDEIWLYDLDGGTW